MAITETSLRSIPPVVKRVFPAPLEHPISVPNEAAKINERRRGYEWRGFNLSAAGQRSTGVAL
jgi:hypothetical protein